MDIFENIFVFLPPDYSLTQFIMPKNQETPTLYGEGADDVDVERE